MPAVRLLLALLLSLALLARPALAQSVLRDAETEKFLNDISAPLIVASGLDPKNVRIILLNNKEINAFVAGGQAVYIHSGLIEAADSANELQGVIAHELGHVAGGHVIRQGEGAGPATNITLLSLLLGAAAMAAGAGEAGMAALMAGQSAGMGKYLAFSRTVEASTDAFAVKTLKAAGVSGQGMMSFWKKLRAEEYRLSPSYMEIDPYALTHPRSADRARTVEGDLRASPSWSKTDDAATRLRFARIKAKLTGFIQDPEVTLRKFPERDQSEPALYARAYAWHRGAYPDRAVQEVDKLAALRPNDPYYLELKGQILLESGKPREAVSPLRQAVAHSNNDPLIGALLGHALVATEERANLDEARRVLRLAVARDDENPFAWYQLGMIYAAEGDQARAQMATAERYSMTGQTRLALVSAETAMKGLPQGSPDYIRAQDIAMVSRSAIEQERRRR